MHSQKMERQSPSWTQQPGILGAIARFWQRSYAPDYLGLVLLITVNILRAYLIEPFRRMFVVDDVSISYPHAAHERVPPLWMFIYGGGIPLAAIAAWCVLTRRGLHQTHVSILGFLVSLTLTYFLTDVVKNSVGRPRPDLLARCKPAEDTPVHTLVTIAVCTETDAHLLHDGWRSFPSGHSSFSFAGLGYLAFFVTSQLHTLHPYETDLARILLSLIPLFAASLVAISRLEDYRHDVFDVSCGSLLGLAVAYSIYRRYYPGLRERGCREPYPSRWDSELGGSGGQYWKFGPGGVDDVEDQVGAEGSVRSAERIPLTEMR